MCVPRDLSDEGLLCACMCVLKHVPKRIYMCVHACVRVYACVMTRRRREGRGVCVECECAFMRVCVCMHWRVFMFVCAICIYNEFCVYARTSVCE